MFGFIMLNNKLDEDNGFGNYIFGTSPDSYKNLYIEIEEGTSKLFSSDNSAIKISGVEFEYIRVTFLKNKLAALMFQTKHSTATALLKFLEGTYGKPKKVKQNLEWEGQKVHLLYEPDNINKDAIISLYSKEIYANKK